jgi:hypothetical protein
MSSCCLIDSRVQLLFNCLESRDGPCVVVTTLTASILSSEAVHHSLHFVLATAVIWVGTMNAIFLGGPGDKLEPLQNTATLFADCSRYF